MRRLVGSLDDLGENQNLNDDTGQNVDTDQTTDNAQSPTDDTAHNGKPSGKESGKGDKRAYEGTDDDVNNDTDDEVWHILSILKRQGEQFLQCIHAKASIHI